MRHLACWLLVLALPCGSLVAAAPVGGRSAKKGTSKTPAKTGSKSADEESGGTDQKKAAQETSKTPETKPAPPEKTREVPKASVDKDKSADWLRRRAESAGEPTPAMDPDVKAPTRKSSSKVEPKISAEEAPPRKSKADPDAESKATVDRKSATGSIERSKSKNAEDEQEKSKKGGQGIAKKSGEPASDTPKLKTKSASEETSAKSGAKTRSSPDKADPPGKSTADSKTKSRAKAVKGDAKPIIDKAGDPVVERSKETGTNATIAPEEIEDFSANPEAVQTLLRLGLALIERDLTYRYGSADPNSGGMDCSGTVYYLLRAAGMKNVPRDSSGLYVWAQKAGTLHAVQAASLEDSQFAELRPGDLLFWEGTYGVQRDPPISHTMIYLGRERKTGARVMVGASDGRSYRGIRRNGVSVFDFKLPKAESPARFVGYARVPGLGSAP